MSSAGADRSNITSGLLVPIGITSIVLMMVLPLPPFLLDTFLALSLAIATGVFLIALFVEQPLDYSVFPAIVLVATLLRLALNVATTRQILMNGADGGAAAGRIVETFGNVVVGGNVFVGLVVFLILVIINFVVITKGAGRVAEVAARFTLDAMPGKQMAIDADLNAGLVSAQEATRRRQSVSREADFFGAMDGASKFVQGDAIAGLLITGINLIGGLIVGVTSGLGVGEAAETFSILSIGDALVSQIPALLISTAAGIVVTRSATGEQLGRALTSQVLGSRQAVALTAGALALFGLLPGMPMLPFFAMSGGLGYLAWRNRQSAQKDEAEEPDTSEQTVTPGSTEDVETALDMDVLALEVGYELVALVDPSLGGTLVERISVFRRQCAEELGFVVPPVRLRDNLSLAPNAYRVLLLGTEVGRGQIKNGHLLALRPSDATPSIDGEETRDPAFGTAGYWIRPRDREISEALGYAVVDPTTILVTHLSELVRRNASELLGRMELSHLLEVYARTDPKTVEELVPNLLSLSEVLRIMRNLLRNRVSIRDLRTILETLTEAAPSTKDSEQLTELVRQRLSRQLTSNYIGPDGAVSALVLAPDVEELLLRSLQDIADGTGGALAPEQLSALTKGLESATRQQEAMGREAVLLTRADLRRFVSAFVEQKSIPLTVMSFREVEPTVTINPVGAVSLAGS